LMQIWGQQKRRFEDIKETTRFGELDKYKLQSIYTAAIQRLNIQTAKPPPGYVTNDKSLNASALRLGGLLGGLNGIYLNRQVLYRLSGPEIQSVIGHELGHYFRFRLTGDRFQLLTLVLGAMVGIFVIQLVHLEGFFGFVVLAVTSSVFWMINNASKMRYGQTIEFLCDDYGAQLNGVEVSISALLKLYADTESKQLIQLEFLARCAHNPLLSPKEVLDAIQKATPYGDVADTEMYDTIRRDLKNRARKNQTTSVAGFLDYIRDNETDEVDHKAELEQQAKMVNQIERLDWESILTDRNQIELSTDQVEQLAQMILASPEKSLFQIPEIGGDGIHPPIAARILYLWKNQNSSAPLKPAI